jgi:hypothetical protein
MNSGYVIAGYVISIGTLTAYSASLVIRLKRARSRSSQEGER